MKMLTSLSVNLQAGRYRVHFKPCNMKKCFLFLALIISCTIAGAQSLKDLLYSGKLKNDSGTVVRKTDDLSTKIDTVKKKPAEPEKVKTVTLVRDSATGTVIRTDTVLASFEETATASPGANNASAPKDNNKIWKEYIDSLATTLKAEVMPNKKIKSGTYYVFVEYEIAPDGQVSINNVSPSPENSFLADQVKERLTISAPAMAPVLYNGKPRKSVKKYTFTIEKQ